MSKRSDVGELRGIDDALFARVAKQAWFHRFPRGWPFLLFMIIAIGTAASVIAIERADRKTRAVELDRNATEIYAGLQRRASENIAALHAAAALFGSVDQVTPEQFKAFTDGLYSRDQNRGALGIGWAPLTPPSQVPELETRVRTRDAGFAIRRDRTASAKLVVPVVNVMPANGAMQPALGYDMYSDPVRRAAMDQALRLEGPVATGRLKLIASAAHPPPIGFLIYVPVYRKVNGHRVAMGFVYSPFSAQAFLDAAAELYRARGVNIALYDQTRDPRNLLASRSAPGSAAASLDRQIVIGHRDWVLHVNTTEGRILTSLSRLTLLFGIVMGLLVMLTARIITRRAAEDREVLEALGRQTAIRTQLTRELNHRVKNTLANVLSIVSLTRRRATDIDEFAASLTARLRALSATHDLLAHSDWTDAPMAEIVRSELAPYIQDGDGHIEMIGPPISLAPNDALSLGLAIHELATNAAKYGALSVPEGRISVTWREISPKIAEVRWRESGGPPVSAPSKRGFGRDLIEKIVAHELRSEVDLQFKPEGVECRLQVPVRRTGAFELRSEAIREV